MVLTPWGNLGEDFQILISSGIQHPLEFNF